MEREIPQLELREIPIGNGVRELTNGEVVALLERDTAFRNFADLCAEEAGCATNAHLARRAAVVQNEVMRAREMQERAIIRMGMQKKGFSK